MTYRLFLIILIGMPSTFASAAATDSDAAAQIVANLQSGILRVDVEFTPKADDKSNFAARVVAVTPLIEATHDLAYMARMTIKSHWDRLDDQERQQFVRAFSELSVVTYAARFRDLANVKFRTVNMRPMPRGRAEIQTELIEETANVVALNYVLHNTADGWRIINVLADGVSELALKRTQYQKILQTQGFAALQRHIQQQQTELAAE